MITRSRRCKWEFFGIILLASLKCRISGKNIGGKYRFTGQRFIRQNIDLQSEIYVWEEKKYKSMLN